MIKSQRNICREMQLNFFLTWTMLTNAFNVILLFLSCHSPDNVPKPPPPEPAWSDIPSEVNHLTAATFDPFLQANRHVLAMFYAPWCGHCKRAKPSFQEAADQLKEIPDRKMAAVDCTVEKSEYRTLNLLPTSPMQGFQ